MLLICINEKFSLFIPSKDEILVQKHKFRCMRRRQDVISSVDVHMELTPYLSHPHALNLSLDSSPPCGRHKWIASYLNKWGRKLYHVISIACDEYARSINICKDYKYLMQRL